MQDYETLGLFYLGRPYDLEAGRSRPEPLLYDSTDLVTHAVCVGMTGSGKTGLCLDLLEEAAIDGIPALAIDPKGDLGNLLLTFPELRPEDFRPWIDEAAAGREGKTPAEWAAVEAETWRQGLSEWGQDGARIRKFRNAVDLAIYTPGSDAGLPLSILKSFDPPGADLMEHADLMRERVATTATSLLGLLGIGADPLQSREHILLSTLFDLTWRRGERLDLQRLIQLVQTPPVPRIGVLDLEAFCPSAERFQLAMALNNLLAAPSFRAWSEGEPLDIQRLLYTPEGKPRLTVLSIAHLGDAERMFFVSLLLNQVLDWMRRQPGTSSLRALVYMDEIAGYLPPVANPPSKAPMLTLLKQARGFGVGMVLATQNPVDLDYKALSNAGTWFIGRLQTERDHDRVLDGLEGATAAAGAAFDRAAFQRIVSGLAKRVFLLHNVHERAPVVFESRWALSYLRGPLTRAQIRELMASRKAASEALAAHAEPQTGSQAPDARDVAAAPAGARTGGSGAEGDTGASWILPPEIPQYFAPVPEGGTLRPMLAGVADVRFTDRRTGTDLTRQVTVVTPITDGAIPVDWDRAEPAPFAPQDLSREPPEGAAASHELPRAASRAASYARWTRAFKTWLSRTQTLELCRSPGLKLVSEPGEAEGDFRARMQLVAREQRDDAVARLRQKHARKVAALQERYRRPEQAVAREQQQVSSQQMDTAISFGATLLGALFGRKTLSAGTVGRATTAARGMRRVSKESGDVVRAQETLAAVKAQIDELESRIASEVAGIEASYQPATERLETIAITPRRGGVHVQLVALTWVGKRNIDE